MDRGVVVVMHKYTLDVHAIYTVHAGDVAMHNT